MRAFALSILAIFAPIQPLLLAVGFLIAADTLTGIMAAHKRGEKITSSGFSRSIAKLFIYQTVIVTGFLMEKYLIADLGLPVVKLLAGVIGVTEFVSLLENAESITGLNFSKIKKLLSSKNAEEPNSGKQE